MITSNNLSFGIAEEKLEDLMIDILHMDTRFDSTDNLPEIKFIVFEGIFELFAEIFEL